ncbi:hypothetical protein ABZ766_15485 [Streptomyces sp. NPDC006670]|uniref:hypothetical protein n=1 Tax=Streptomyces sp. NPDC006670 TaxID=3154476 RepID=UPI003405F2F3
MSQQPRVVVHPPDGRGLRAVTVDGSPAGSAWSPRDLRNQLRRAGLPKETDLADRARVTWRGGGMDTWPDRPWRRRCVIALVAAGLLASMVLLVDVGWVDVFGALTFAGRITGGLFVAAGAVQGVAAAAAFDFWGKRVSRYSGALVLVGVFIAVATECAFLVLWFQKREFTPYVPVFFAISLWAVWALCVLWRHQPWKGLPHPKSFTVGLTTTAVVAVANFAYSTVYQPAAARLTFSMDVTFGKPVPDRVLPVVHLPVTVRTTNTGTVPAYVLAAGYRVAGRISTFDKSRTQFEEKQWRTAAEGPVDTELHVLPTGYQTLNIGPAIGPGLMLNPGETRESMATVQIPDDAKYDQVSGAAGIVLLRADKGRVGDEFGNPVFSWQQKKDPFFDCAPKQCPDYVMHLGRYHYNNNLMNVTRRPRYLSSYRVLNENSGQSYISVTSYNAKGKLSNRPDSQDSSGITGLQLGTTVIPFAAVLPPQPVEP